MHQKLIDRLDTYQLMWLQSEAAARVDAVEGFAILHGYNQYEGQTIPELLSFVLSDFLVYLAENPELLATVEVPGREEAKKELKSIYLTGARAYIDEMSGYFWGSLDPRWHKAHRKARECLKQYDDLEHK